MAEKKEQICKICGKKYIKTFWNLDNFCDSCFERKSSEYAKAKTLIETKFKGYTKYASIISSELSTYLSYRSLVYFDIEKHWLDVIKKYSCGFDPNELVQMQKRDYKTLTEKEATEFIERVYRLKDYSFQSGLLYSREYDVILDADDVFAVSYKKIAVNNPTVNTHKTHMCMFFSTDPYVPVLICYVDIPIGTDVTEYLSGCCHKLKVAPFPLEEVEKNTAILLDNTQYITSDDIVRLTDIAARNAKINGFNFPNQDSNNGSWFRDTIGKNGYLGLESRSESELIQNLVNLFTSTNIDSFSSKECFWAKANYLVKYPEKRQELIKDETLSEEIPLIQKMNVFNGADKTKAANAKQYEKMADFDDSLESFLKKTGILLLACGIGAVLTLVLGISIFADPFLDILLFASLICTISFAIAEGWLGTALEWFLEGVNIAVGFAGIIGEFGALFGPLGLLLYVISLGVCLALLVMLSIIVILIAAAIGGIVFLAQWFFSIIRLITRH